MEQKRNNMKNIHIIPTYKPSRLHLGNSGLILCDLIFNSGTINSQHIYITSDEEIKKGDWYLFKYQIIKCENVDLTKIPIVTKNYCKKVILTTDQDLIKDGVQAIDDDFLEWFVQNPSCEEVEVIKEYKDGYGCWYKYQDDFFSDHFKPFAIRYKIIIPKEEPK